VDDPEDPQSKDGLGHDHTSGEGRFGVVDAPEPGKAGNPGESVLGIETTKGLRLST
jgi:hypothetical protein